MFVKPGLWLWALLAPLALTVSPAFGHSFNVALIIPMSKGAADQGRQIQNGFMLATAERDSHPDQESDGHLGGLDVYVTIIDETGDVAADIKRLAGKADTDIVIAISPDAQKTAKVIAPLLAGTNITLLTPGSTPFTNKSLPGVIAFGAAYQKSYGTAPTALSARGYNAARRIDRAVRAQSGVGDRASLRQNLADSARRFTW